jgi:hypothetical protein
MKAPRKALAIGLLPAALLVGCSSGSPKAAPQASPPNPVRTLMTNSSAQNPVDILRKVRGCVIPAGTVSGSHDLMGERYASCDFMNNGNVQADGSGGTAGTGVTVYTGVLAANRPADVSDDNHQVITGFDFVLILTQPPGGYNVPVDPQTVASEVGGTYTP